MTLLEMTRKNVTAYLTDSCFPKQDIDMVTHAVNGFPKTVTRCINRIPKVATSTV